MPATRPKARASRPPRQAGLGPSGIQLGDETVPLWSGALHYFRLRPDDWRPALRSLQGLGISIVETYVPWGVHEMSFGRYDFGQHKPSLNLEAFLDVVEELGLKCILRPGPHINAELTYFGLPRRVVDDPRCQARSAQGDVLPFVAPPRMFAVPSYASRQFRAETNTWFAEVCKRIKPRLWPNGPVIMVQVDNEAAYYFRDGPYDQDYHPDAIADYRDFLKARHGTLAVVNDSYGTDHRSWKQVQPPHRFEAALATDLRRQLDWMGFQEQLLCQALGEMGKGLRRHLGQDTLLMHNLPMGDMGLATSLAAVDQVVDLVALDYYHSRRGHRVIRDRTARLAGSCILPYAAELGVGAPPFFGSRPDSDAMTTALYALAYGLRGFNLYMAVDRDRWYGAPIDARGNPRPSADAWRILLGALADLQFHRLRRDVRVALIVPREYAQLTRASHGLGALTPTLLDVAGIGPGAASQPVPALDDSSVAQWWQLLRSMADCLDTHNVPFVLVDSLAPIPAAIETVICPSYEFADPTLWQRLLDHAQAGGTTLVGPGFPHRDHMLRNHQFADTGLHRFSARTTEEAEAFIVELMSGSLRADDFACDEPTVRIAVHRDAAGPRVVFVMQTGSEFVEAVLGLPKPTTLCDVMTSERYAGEATACIPMTGYSCRMLRVEAADAS